MSERISKSGLTLLEVMVALAIIATVLVTLLGTQTVSLNLARRHDEQTRIGLLVREKMEQVYTTPFDSLASESSEWGEEESGFEWEVEVTESNIPNLADVMIVIKLPDREFKLKTLVAETSIDEPIR